MYYSSRYSSRNLWRGQKFVRGAYVGADKRTMVYINCLREYIYYIKNMLICNVNHLHFIAFLYTKHIVFLHNHWFANFAHFD
jgi:hypothetical protein